MSAIELVLQQPWVARAGWTLVHFLWQGTLIAVLLAAVRGAAGRRLGPRARYAMACLALGLMTVAPLATFLMAGSVDGRALPAPVWRVSGGAAWERALPWLVVWWLCGVAVFSARLIGGWRLTTRLRTVAVRPAPPEWQRALEGLTRRLRVSAPVRLLISSRVAVPVVVGWLRPVILMPAAALTGLPLEHAQALLAHELAHIFRHDYLVNILQSVAEAVLFYHPAVWWVSGQIRAERELCCDDLAVAVSGDPLTYAYALAELESGRRTRLKAALAADGGSLLQRIRRLAGESEALSHSLPGPGTAWALSLLWLAGIGAAAIHAAQTPVALAAHAAPPAVQGLALTQRPAEIGRSPVATRQKESRPGSLPHLTAALLFDPLFEPPQVPAQEASEAVPPKKTHLEGMVFSVAGDPLKKATVRLAPIDAVPTQLTQGFSETTDDSGKFAIEDVPPGSYTLTATKSGFVSGSYGGATPSSPGAAVTVTEGASVKDLDIRLTPQGIITGHVVDVDGEPVSHGWVKLFDTAFVNGRRSTNYRGARTNSLGNFSYSGIPPGRYYLSAEVLEQSADVEPGMGDVATYYPGALDPSGATAIAVTAGARMDGINVRLRRERVYSVAGKVTLNGAPLKTGMSVEVIPPADRPSWGLGIRDGEFRMHDQLPGVYTLLAYANGGSCPTCGLTGRLQFAIKDSNVDGLVLALEPDVELAGVFKLDGADWQTRFNQPPAPTGTASPVSHPMVRLAPEDPAGISTVGTANDAGAFAVRPAATGNYLMDVMGLPSGAYVKSVRGMEDVTHAPLRLTARGGAVKIDVSLKGAVVTGALRGDDGAPLRGILVTLWSKTPDLGSPTHGVRTASTNQSGMFTIGRLAPGEYYLAAWEELDSGLRQYRDFLEKFTERAEAVKLDEGSQAAVSVKLIPKDVAAAEAAKLQ